VDLHDERWYRDGLGMLDRRQFINVEAGQFVNGCVEHFHTICDFRIFCGALDKRPCRYRLERQKRLDVGELLRMLVHRDHCRIASESDAQQSRLHVAGVLARLCVTQRADDISRRISSAPRRILSRDIQGMGKEINIQSNHNQRKPRTEGLRVA